MIEGAPQDSSGAGDEGGRLESPPQPGLPRRLVGGTLNYGLGQSLPQLVRFCLLPFFTRVLTPAEYGVIDLSNTFGGFVSTPMKMGVPGAVTRYYFDYPEGPSLKDYVTTVALFLFWCSLIMGGLALAVFPRIGHWIPGLPLFPFALLAVLSMFFYANQELQGRLVQAREQSGYAARLNIGRASISISLAVLFVLGLRWGAVGMLSAEVASYGVLMLIAAIYLRPELTGKFRLPMLRSSLSYGMAMLPGDFVGTLTPLITRSLLSGLKSIADVGLLTTATKFMQPLNILGTAFQMAYNPIYFSVRKQIDAGAPGADRLAQTARNVWAAGVGAAIGAALLGPPLIVLVLPASYHAAAALLPILVVGFLGTTIYNVLGGPEVYYSKHTGWVPVIAYGAAAMEITVSLLTVSRYGAAGVAWAAAARLVTTAVLGTIISARLVRIPYPWFSLARIALCGAVAVTPALLLPVAGTLRRIGVGCDTMLLYAALLWLTGDPSVRQGMSLAWRKLSKFQSS